jgi:REP element-mobilizing transposase RayT
MTDSYRVFTDKNYLYFITWPIVDWLPIFAEPAYRQLILDSLNYLRTSKKTELNAFEIMLSHVHVILWPDDGIHLSDVIRDFKRFTSRKFPNSPNHKIPGNFSRPSGMPGEKIELRMSQHTRYGRKAHIVKLFLLKSSPCRSWILST